MKMNMKKHIIGFMVFALTVAVTTKIQAMEADTAIGMYQQYSNGWSKLGGVNKTGSPEKAQTDHLVAANFCQAIKSSNIGIYFKGAEDSLLKPFDIQDLNLELCLGIIANFESNAIGSAF